MLHPFKMARDGSEKVNDALYSVGVLAMVAAVPTPTATAFDIPQSLRETKPSTSLLGVFAKIIEAIKDNIAWVVLAVIVTVAFISIVLIIAFLIQGSGSGALKAALTFAGCFVGMVLYGAMARGSWADLIDHIGTMSVVTPLYLR
jgi:hypothetical protein